MGSLEDIPWIFGGDFNMVEHPQDKSRGNKFKWKPNEKFFWMRMVNKLRIWDLLAGNKPDC